MQGILKNGQVVITGGDFVERYQWPRIIKRYGENPFHISKGHMRAYPLAGGMVIGKNSALYDVLNPYIMKMREGDIIEQISRSFCWFWKPEPKEEKLFPLGLPHLWFGFYLYGIGIILGTLTLGMEYAKVTFMKRQRNST